LVEIYKEFKDNILHIYKFYDSKKCELKKNNNEKNNNNISLRIIEEIENSKDVINSFYHYNNNILRYLDKNNTSFENISNKNIRSFYSKNDSNNSDFINLNNGIFNENEINKNDIDFKNYLIIVEHFDIIMKLIIIFEPLLFEMLKNKSKLYQNNNLYQIINNLTIQSKLTLLMKHFNTDKNEIMSSIESCIHNYETKNYCLIHDTNNSSSSSLPQFNNNTSIIEVYNLLMCTKLNTKIQTLIIEEENMIYNHTCFTLLQLLKYQVEIPLTIYKNTFESEHNLWTKFVKFIKFNKDNLNEILKTPYSIPQMNDNDEYNNIIESSKIVLHKSSRSYFKQNTNPYFYIDNGTDNDYVILSERLFENLKNISKSINEPKKTNHGKINNLCDNIIDSFKNIKNEYLIQLNMKEQMNFWCDLISIEKMITDFTQKYENNFNDNNNNIETINNNNQVRKTKLHSKVKKKLNKNNEKKIYHINNNIKTNDKLLNNNNKLKEIENNDLNHRTIKKNSEHLSDLKNRIKKQNEDIGNMSNCRSQKMSSSHKVYKLDIVDALLEIIYECILSNSCSFSMYYKVIQNIKNINDANTDKINSIIYGKKKDIDHITTKTENNENSMNEIDKNKYIDREYKNNGKKLIPTDYFGEEIQNFEKFKKEYNYEFGKLTTDFYYEIYKVFIDMYQMNYISIQTITVLKNVYTTLNFKEGLDNIKKTMERIKNLSDLFLIYQFLLTEVSATRIKIIKHERSLANKITLYYARKEKANSNFNYTKIDYGNNYSMKTNQLKYNNDPLEIKRINKLNSILLKVKPYEFNKENESLSKNINFESIPNKESSKYYFEVDLKDLICENKDIEFNLNLSHCCGDVNDIIVQQDSNVLLDGVRDSKVNIDYMIYDNSKKSTILKNSDQSKLLNSYKNEQLDNTKNTINNYSSNVSKLENIKNNLFPFNYEKIITIGCDYEKNAILKELYKKINACNKHFSNVKRMTESNMRDTNKIYINITRFRRLKNRIESLSNSINKNNGPHMNENLKNQQIEEYNQLVKHICEGEDDDDLHSKIFEYDTNFSYLNNMKKNARSRFKNTSKIHQHWNCGKKVAVANSDLYDIFNNDNNNCIVNNTKIDELDNKNEKWNEIPKTCENSNTSMNEKHDSYSKKEKENNNCCSYYYHTFLNNKWIPNIPQAPDIASNELISVNLLENLFVYKQYEELEKSQNPNSKHNVKSNHNTTMNNGNKSSVKQNTTHKIQYNTVKTNINMFKKIQETQKNLKTQDDLNNMKLNNNDQNNKKYKNKLNKNNNDKKRKYANIQNSDNLKKEELIKKNTFSNNNLNSNNEKNSDTAHSKKQKLQDEDSKKNSDAKNHVDSTTYLSEISTIEHNLNYNFNENISKLNNTTQKLLTNTMHNRKGSQITHGNSSCYPIYMAITICSCCGSITKYYNCIQHGNNYYCTRCFKSDPNNFVYIMNDFKRNGNVCIPLTLTESICDRIFMDTNKIEKSINNNKINNEKLPKVKQNDDQFINENSNTFNNTDLKIRDNNNELSSSKNLEQNSSKPSIIYKDLNDMNNSREKDFKLATLRKQNELFNRILKSDDKQLHKLDIKQNYTEELDFYSKLKHNYVDIQNMIIRKHFIKDIYKYCYEYLYEFGNQIDAVLQELNTFSMNYYTNNTRKNLSMLDKTSVSQHINEDTLFLLRMNEYKIYVSISTEYFKIVDKDVEFLLNAYTGSNSLDTHNFKNLNMNQSFENQNNEIPNYISNDITMNQMLDINIMNEKIKSKSNQYINYADYYKLMKKLAFKVPVNVNNLMNNNKRIINTNTNNYTINNFGTSDEFLLSHKSNELNSTFNSMSQNQSKDNLLNSNNLYYNIMKNDSILDNNVNKNKNYKDEKCKENDNEQKKNPMLSTVIINNLKLSFNHHNKYLIIENNLMNEHNIVTNNLLSIFTMKCHLEDDLNFSFSRDNITPSHSPYTLTEFNNNGKYNKSVLAALHAYKMRDIQSRISTSSVNNKNTVVHTDTNGQYELSNKRIENLNDHTNDLFMQKFGSTLLKRVYIDDDSTL
jgi:ribosomal protein L25 (general stress protein Ctc)